MAVVKEVGGRVEKTQNGRKEGFIAKLGGQGGEQGKTATGFP